MSTNDVPGANPANGDDLAMGCWAEHDKDDVLLFVEGAEGGGRVIYSVFDLDRMIEYRDAMPEKAFKGCYTKDGWTWHDKTAFPWQKVMDQPMAMIWLREERLSQHDDG